MSRAGAHQALIFKEETICVLASKDSHCETVPGSYFWHSLKATISCPLILSTAFVSTQPETKPVDSGEDGIERGVLLLCPWLR